MARKKAIIVDYKVQGRAWMIRVRGGGDPAIRDDVVQAVRDIAAKHSALILNATDPFGSIPVSEKAE